MIGLPLFARELTARAARRRTYVARVVFGLVLYALFLAMVARAVQDSGGGFRTFGIGRKLLQQLVEMLALGVLIFQPALMAGGITYEKERNSLTLLLLTGMAPARIVTEKFLAGLLPMATLLLLALPAGAITMAYGGVSANLLASAALVLGSTWLLTGAVALLCSAWLRTTAGAMTASYVAVLLVPVLPALIMAPAALVGKLGMFTGAEAAVWLETIWPPSVFARVLEFQSSQPGAPLLFTLKAVAPFFAIAAACLLVSTRVLVRNAEPPAREVVHRPPKPPGRFARWIYRQLPPQRVLPGDEPVAWRESARGALGRTANYLQTLALLAVAATAVTAMLYYIPPRTDGAIRIQIFGAALGGVYVLVLVLRSISTVLNEHTGQTLDIMLTTPLGAADILSQKVAALRRYRILFWLMLAIVFGAHGWSVASHVRTMSWRELMQHWLCVNLALTVYPALIIWVSFLFAVLLRTRARAVGVTLLFFLVWLVVPLAILEFTDREWRNSSSKLWLSLLSPAGIVDATMNAKLAWFSTESAMSGRTIIKSGHPGSPVAFNFGFYATLAAVLRWVCCRYAPRWLRRV